MTPAGLHVSAASSPVPENMQMQGAGEHKKLIPENKSGPRVQHPETHALVVRAFCPN